MIESQIAYILDAIKTMDAEGIKRGRGPAGGAARVRRRRPLVDAEHDLDPRRLHELVPRLRGPQHHPLAVLHLPLPAADPALRHERIPHRSLCDIDACYIRSVTYLIEGCADDARCTASAAGVISRSRCGWPIYSAAAAVAVSFFALAAFWSRPRFEQSAGTTLAAADACRCDSRPVRWLLKAIGLAASACCSGRPGSAVARRRSTRRRPGSTSGSGSASSRCRCCSGRSGGWPIRCARSRRLVPRTSTGELPARHRVLAGGCRAVRVPLAGAGLSGGLRATRGRRVRHRLRRGECCRGHRLWSALVRDRRQLRGVRRGARAS